MPIYGKPRAEGDAPPIIGVAQCLNKRSGGEGDGGGGGFSPEDEAVMSALCHLFSVCICHAQLHEREQRLHRQKQALLELATALTTKLDLLPLIRAVRTSACSVMSAERCTLFLVDATSQRLVFHVSEEEGGALFTLPIGEGAAGHCAATATPINIDHAYDDPRFSDAVDSASGSVT